MQSQINSLLKKPGKKETGIYQSISAEKAGWELLNFEARILNKDEEWQFFTDNKEYALVILGGSCSVSFSGGYYRNVGKRKNVFDGMPYALYFSANTEVEIKAETEILDIAYAWCLTNENHPAALIKPDQMRVEIRGGGNATRQINHILPPGFNCHRLVACEVYTPSGNWSSFPPHKHDQHIEKGGQLIEADLEEIYFYKVDKPKGYAIQRVYTTDNKLNETMIAENNDVILVPEGYHPVVAAHGFNIYYLNFLAGSAQSLQASDDPDFAWIKSTWKEKDNRLPMVK